MKTKLHTYLLNPDTGKVLVVFFVLTMFLPRVVKKGMFGDGLLYSSISRNLAEGRGTYWKPFFPLVIGWKICLQPTLRILH